MKKILLLCFTLIVFNSCSDNNPVNGSYYRTVTYTVTGPQTDVLITISGANELITQYSHVDLPFDLYPFKVEAGSFVGLNVLDWNNTDSLMTVQIIVDGAVYKSITGTRSLELYGNAN